MLSRHLAVKIFVTGIHEVLLVVDGCMDDAQLFSKAEVGCLNRFLQPLLGGEESFIEFPLGLSCGFGRHG